MHLVFNTVYINEPFSVPREAPMECRPATVLNGQDSVTPYHRFHAALGKIIVQTVYVVNAAGVVEAVAVQKGATAQGLTEIKDAAALKGAAIVREGMLLLNPGDVVKPVQ